jgi:DNA-binding IscR family transcriptional regulator
MLVFSNTCQYSIKACIVLATERRRIGIKDISEKIGTQTAFTSEILQQLTKKEVISSGKGKGGRFYLNF